MATGGARWGLAAGGGLAGAAAVAVAIWLGRTRRPRRDVPGERTTAGSAALDAGAALLQGHAPLAGFDVYLVGFHPMKDDPNVQMEAHHWCRQLNDDVMQCVLFDGNGPDARLNGVEYIVSERVYQALPPEERASWHPHDYEILSGQLVAPGIPEPVERALMRKELNSYGKTWHVWHTGGPGKAADPLPLGAPHLAWSFDRDGEADAAMIAARDRRLGVDTAAVRRARAPLAAEAHPQGGVAAIREAFSEADGAPEGVRDASAPT